MSRRRTRRLGSSARQPDETSRLQELRGFDRVTLAAGAQKTASFRLTPEILGYWDRTGRFRTDAGRYDLWIAPEAKTGPAVSYRVKSP